MGGVDHRDAVAVARGERGLGRVGEVGVDHVGPAGRGEMIDERAGEAGDLACEVVLAKIAGPRRREAEDAEPGRHRLLGQRVGRAERGLLKAARDDLHLDAGQAGLGARGAEHVGDVPAGVLRDPVGHRGRLDASTERDVHDPHTRLPPYSTGDE